MATFTDGGEGFAAPGSVRKTIRSMCRLFAQHGPREGCLAFGEWRGPPAAMAQSTNSLATHDVHPPDFRTVWHVYGQRVDCGVEKR